MSARAFAEFVDANHATINKFLQYGEKETGYPSVEFLIRLAKATQKDIGYLMTLVAPPDLVRSELEPEAIDLAQAIMKLPPTYRKIVDQIIQMGLEEIAATNHQNEGEK